MKLYRKIDQLISDVVNEKWNTITFHDKMNGLA